MTSLFFCCNNQTNRAAGYCVKERLAHFVLPGGDFQEERNPRKLIFRSSWNMIPRRTKSLWAECYGQIARLALLKAAYAVNSEMILFYWQLGTQILEKQLKATWGDKFLERLSQDLQIEFPGTKGFSVRNLKYMRRFAKLYPELTIGEQPVAQLPWGHIIVLMEKVKDPEAREWYANNALKNGIARSVLIMQIEHSMTKHLSKVFLELGTGFAYMGNQYKITVDGMDFFLDMLFYHTRLHCYFVTEIKTVELKPEHIGKLNFYLAAVDEILKSPTDNPSIGLLLCQKKSKIIAEYSLKRTDGPIGVAEYRLMHELPHELKTELPSTKILQTKLSQKIKEPA